MVSNTFKIGDKFLLPIEISDFGNAYGYLYAKNPSGCEVPIYPADIPTLIPADDPTDLQADVGTLRHYLTATADYLEALGDALTLMPPEMRDPRDVADEIREMLS